MKHLTWDKPPRGYSVYWGPEGVGRCERCLTRVGVVFEDSRTMYHWDGKGDDPNAPVMLCRRCAEEHHEYWDGMWEEYDSSRR